MHAVALIGANPHLVGYGVVGEVSGELAEIDNVGNTSRIGWNVFVRDERIVLPLV